MGIFISRYTHMKLSQSTIALSLKCLRRSLLIQERVLITDKAVESEVFLKCDANKPEETRYFFIELNQAKTLRRGTEDKILRLKKAITELKRMSRGV